MYIYIILIFSAIVPTLFIDVNKNDSIKKIYLFFVFSLAFLFSALRNSSVGYDTEAFCRTYVATGQLDWNRLSILREEIGFLIICKLLNYISGSYQLLFIATGLFFSFVFARYIYLNSNNVALSTVVYLCMFFEQSLNLMRQYIAMCFIILAFEYIKKNKIMKLILFLIIAFSIHQASLVCLVYIPCNVFNFKKTSVVFLAPIFAALLVFYRQVAAFILNIVGTYDSYFGSIWDVSSGTQYFKALIAASVLIVLLINKNKIIISKLNINFIINAILCWMFLALAAARMSIFSRLIYFYDIIAIIAIPIAIDLKKIKNRHLYIPLVNLFLIIYLFSSLLFFDRSGANVYHFFTEVTII